MAGLVVVGQLFNTNQIGQVNAASIKSYEALEIEFGITIPAHLRNSITMMVHKIKQEYRHTISSSTQMYEKITALKGRQLGWLIFQDYKVKEEQGEIEDWKEIHTCTCFPGKLQQFV